VVTTIRPYYDAVIAVGPIALVVGFIAAVIAGDSSPFPIAAIVFLLTGAFLSFRLWRKSRTSALALGSTPALERHRAPHGRKSRQTHINLA
jgi:hypothetical protein